MSADRLVKYRLFVAWADHKEEKWLEEMEAQGWRLVKGGIRFVFERGEPRQMRYRLDYRPTYPQGESEYFAMFRDAGWEHAGDYFSWHYFRSPAAAGAPEIFTDAESRAAKYRRLLIFLAIILASNLGVLPGLLDRNLLERTSPLGMSVLLMNLAALLFISYAAIRLALHIRRIKSQRAVR